MRFLRRFSVLRRIHRGETIASPEDNDELRARLRRLVDRGVVEVVTVGKHRSSLDEEAWFRDRRTGAVYRYVPPDWPSSGHWGPVEEPGAPSFFEAMCPDLYPTRAQYDALVAALDAAWARGEIEAAEHPEPGELANVFFHHRKSDESYHLILVNPYQQGGSWMKTFHSHKNGSWPGQLIVRPPPWRRGEPGAPTGPR